MLNPVSMLMCAYQDVFYYKRWPSFEHLGVVALLGVALFGVGSYYMAAKRENFAEVA